MGNVIRFGEAWDACVDAVGQDDAALAMLDCATEILVSDRDRRWRYCALVACFLLGLAAVLGSTCGCSGSPKLRTNAERASDAAFVERWCFKGGDVWHGQTSANGEAAGGTLVVVGPHRAITAAHVVACEDGYLGMRARLSTGAHVDLAVLEVDAKLDVALVYSAQGFGDVRPPKVRAPRVGEYACSHSAAPLVGRHCGPVIESGEGDGGIVGLFETRHGNSGSGLYGLDGALLGIVVQLDVDTATTVPLITGDPDATAGGKATMLFGHHAEWYK